jgi:hypothetical protein
MNFPTVQSYFAFKLSGTEKKWGSKKLSAYTGACINRREYINKMSDLIWHMPASSNSATHTMNDLNNVISDINLGGT